MSWKTGEVCTVDRHMVYFSGEENRHEHGMGFLVHNDIMSVVLGCRPVSSRLIRLRPGSSSITAGFCTKIWTR